MKTDIATRDRKRVEETKDLSAKTIATCSPNDAWRQGDLEIRFLGSDKPSIDLKAIDVPTQLAPGTTKGSRHGLIGEGIKAYVITDPNPLEGPMLECPNGLTVPHPEHGDITIKEPGWYAITYQRAFADEIKRQLD